MRAFTFKLFLLITVLILCSDAFGQFPFTKYPGNPLFIHGAPGTWHQVVYTPYVIYNPDSSRFEMWFTAWYSYPNAGIGFAKSSDGIIWEINPTPVMTPGPNGWDSLFVGAVCVIRENGIYKMWYTGWKSTTGYPHSIGYATSPNGITNWTKHANPVLIPGTGWESGAVGYPSVLKETNGYRMFYTGEISTGIVRTGRAYSTDGITWQRDLVNNPVLQPGAPGAWDRNNYLARVMQMNDSLYMWYTAENNPGVSGTAIGFATSGDSGKTWTKYSGNPVLSRGTGWDAGWIETGGVVFKDSLFYLYYDGGVGPLTAKVGLATAPFIPVELTSFTASSNGNQVILSWSTATETNNKGFGIERKPADSEYSEIGFIPGYGTTTENISYTYTDSKVSPGIYTYRLKQIDLDGSYEYSPEVEVEVTTPIESELEQNYPNPFNPSTNIQYSVSTKQYVTLVVYDIIGNEVATLVNEEKPAGTYEVEFNPPPGNRYPASGIYFYQLKAGEYIQTKKMILIK